MKQQVLQEALFLVDVVHNEELGFRYEPVYQLVPEAMNSNAASDGCPLILISAPEENKNKRRTVYDCSTQAATQVDPHPPP